MKMVKRVIDALRHCGARHSYSQCGEDLIVDFVLKDLGITAPTYLDVGAYGPRSLSNSYLFYRRGSTGVCVEPNPALCRSLARARPRDLCLNIGVGSCDATLDFYLLNPPTLSTFVAKNAETIQAEGAAVLDRVIPVSVLRLDAVFERYCRAIPDFLSIDTEGQEMAILSATDLERNRPAVVCAETISFSTDHEGKKDQDLIDFMRKKRYRVYADTYVNTIFVDERKWGGS